MGRRGTEEPHFTSAGGSLTPRCDQALSSITLGTQSGAVLFVMVESTQVLPCGLTPDDENTAQLGR